MFIYEVANLIFVYLVGFVLYRFVQDDRYFSPFLSEYVLRFGLLIVLLLPIRVLFDVISSSVSLRGRLFILSALLFASFFYLSSSKQDYVLIVFGIAGMFSILTLFLALDALLYLVTEHQMQRHYPEGLVIHNLLLVVPKIDLRSDLRRDLEFKLKCSDRLEHAAKAMERHLYRRLKTNDPELNAWFRERCEQIAYAVRDKKKWVFTPIPDTPEYLARALADIAIYFMHNEWDSLEGKEITKPSLRESISGQIPMVLRALFIGLLPLGVLLALQSSKLVQPFDESVYRIVAIWAIVNLLWLDPSAKEKLSGTKDAFGALAGK